MATYAIDSGRQPMTATGIVEPVREWTETADGKRRPSEVQAREPETGMPLWGVEVLYVQTSFGRESTVTARVTVPAAERPAPAKLTPIGFTGLVMEARINKTGGFTESWSAEGVLDASPAGTASRPGPKSAPRETDASAA